MSREKSPGCDGLPVEFYITFFERIKWLLLDTINSAYRTGCLHDSATRGVISLILKKNKDTRYIKNMRPISLLNCDYKILEKILANRLKPALSNLIYQDQKGYMQNRRISCNIRCILDLIQYCESEDLPGVVISIDFKKCFDIIDIEALIQSMKYFNIGKSYQRWIKLTYNQSKSCIVNNGYFSPYMNITRSVRQGGPNSAYLFLLLAEVLALEIRSQKAIRGFLVDQIMRVLGQFDMIWIFICGEREK